VEIRNGSRLQMEHHGSEKPSGGRENEIIRQAEMEHEILRKQRFLDISRKIEVQPAFKCNTKSDS